MFAKNQRDVNRVKQTLEKDFILRALGESPHFLGIEMDWSNKESLFFIQDILVLKLLNKNGIHETNSVGTPL